MSFIVDRQTQDDLNLFSSNRRQSIFGIFNQTRTRGGAEVLKQIFNFPLSDAEKINGRATTIAYLQQHGIGFTFKGEWFDAAEYYLSQADERIFQIDHRNSLHHKMKGYIERNSAIDMVLSGIDSIRLIVLELDRMMPMMDGDSEFMKQLQGITSRPFYRYCIDRIPAGRIQPGDVNEHDMRLRRDSHKDIEMMLHAIYELDCYTAVAAVAAKNGYTSARVTTREENIIDIKGLYHPLVPDAVANDIHVDSSNNVVFLTGANMAGKSTFMKAFSVAVYLAHTGLPVAASDMTLSIQQGMYTSINLADNLKMGFSHFYAEVQRIRKVAECIRRTPRIVIVFDELFRGTNVRDAFEATLAITRAFATHPQCTFMISTHIIETGNELADDHASVQFRYFPTIMEGNIPRYTYRLTEGITTDRQGMLIITNEHIPEMLENGIREKAAPADHRFLVDKQTLDDLKILGKFKRDSIFSMFNRTHTRGGETLLNKWFNSPMTDADAINARSAMFARFMKIGLEFPFKKSEIADIDNFLSEEYHTGKMSSTASVIRKKLLYCIGSQGEFEHTREMSSAIIRFLQKLKNFLPPTDDTEPIGSIRHLLDDEGIRELIAMNPVTVVSTSSVIKCDNIIHYRSHQQLCELLEKLYELDAMISVAGVARERSFAIAKALKPTDGSNLIDIKQVYHPSLRWAVANDVTTDHVHNFIFLTGANMAGKSTFMKAFTTAIYLAHMGFPVAAKEMTFTVQDGLYTSINVADNISQGSSYFYLEVLRVKEVAEQVSEGKRLVVVFDELFKGTNVKDAYNGTLTISKGFSSYSTCTFLLSTHITETAEPLGKENSNIRFIYLPTEMKNGHPSYTYLTREGVSTDRHGMLIIRKEGILDMLVQ